MEATLIHSYKGGTGKTTIAVNLAVQLVRHHDHKVLLIETDFKMPSFNGIFPNINPKYYFNEYFNNKNISLEDCITKSPFSGLDVVLADPEFDPESRLHSWDKRWHHFHLKRLQSSLVEINNKSRYDFLLFDTPPGLSFIAINNIALSRRAIIIIRPDLNAIEGTKRMMKNVYFKAKSPSRFPIYVVYNQIPRVPMTKELDEWTKSFEEINLIHGARIPTVTPEWQYKIAKGQYILPAEHEINNYMSPLIKHLKNEKVDSIPDPTIDLFKHD